MPGQAGKHIVVQHITGMPSVNQESGSPLIAKALTTKTIYTMYVSYLHTASRHCSIAAQVCQPRARGWASPQLYTRDSSAHNEMHSRERSQGQYTCPPSKAKAILTMKRCLPDIHCISVCHKTAAASSHCSRGAAVLVPQQYCTQHRVRQSHL